MQVSPQAAPTSSQPSVSSATGSTSAPVSATPSAQIDAPQLQAKITSAQQALLTQLSASSKQSKFLAQVVRQIENSPLMEVKVLKTNQLLQLQPTSKMQPGQLVLLSETPNGLKLETGAKTAAEQIFKLLLPKQGNVKEALNSALKQVSREGAGLSLSNRPGTAAPTDGERRAVAKVDIGQLLQSVVSKLPSRQEIVKPEVLRQAINDAGLVSLSGKVMSPSAELKTSLQSLLTTAASGSPVASTSISSGNSPGSSLGQLMLPLLKNLLQGAGGDQSSGSHPITPKVTEVLARIMMNQFKTLNLGEADDVEARRTEILARSDNQLDGFQLEITPPKVPPVKDEGEKNPLDEAARDAEKKWTVKLSFEFPELGKITAFIILTGERRLEMNFWSNQPKTFALIKARQTKLQRQLRKRLEPAGIEQFDIEVFEGEVKLPAPSITSQLVNEIA